MNLRLSKFDKILGITIIGILVVGGGSALLVRGLQGDKKKADIPETEIVQPIAIDNLVYTGEPQQLIQPGVCSYGTFYYKVNDFKWDSKIPTQTESGSYLISWIIIGNSSYNNYGSADSPFQFFVEIK